MFPEDRRRAPCHDWSRLSSIRSFAFGVASIFLSIPFTSFLFPLSFLMERDGGGLRAARGVRGFVYGIGWVRC
ncbi:hypothetical protein BU16DRAFT_40667 [Lophium mytilinum]|uniref:Uncharacterized protein n=1 Tax=Lophium mytilinum TaxID=390894 RepID=A0A6A6QPW9_9PEZI|nr:hypothetical protein BU16DRAFT_40667 [Lophium mytilinum]